MTNKNSSLGYNLIEIEHDVWALYQGNKWMCGGAFMVTVMYAVLRLGFRMSDIEVGVNMMLKHGGDACHFGINKTPMFSFESKKEVA